MKKNLCAVMALVLILACSCALAEITVTKRDLNMNKDLDRSVTNILVLLQDGDKTDTIMIASINSRTGRSVMTRMDPQLIVHVEGAGDVPLGEVYVLGDARSRGLLMCRTINDLLGLNVNTYLVLDITRLPEIVDVVGVLNMQYTAQEAAAMGTWEGINELAGDQVLPYVRLRLEDDEPGRSRGYDVLMQLLYQGLKSGDLMGMMGMGTKLLSSMDTNVNVMNAVTLVSAVQAGSDRRELQLPNEQAQTPDAMRTAAHREIYE